MELGASNGPRFVHSFDSFFFFFNADVVSFSPEFQNGRQEFAKRIWEFPKSSKSTKQRFHGRFPFHAKSFLFLFGNLTFASFPCRLLSPVFLVGTPSPKRRWGRKEVDGPQKPNNLFPLWTKLRNKIVKHDHPSTRPPYKIFGENLMGSESEKELARGFDSKQICKWTLPPFFLEKCFAFLFSSIRVVEATFQLPRCATLCRTCATAVWLFTGTKGNTHA